ncbi:MAG: hypothetical protein ACRDT4_25140 [Micromonosporaceae bacterium]
MADPGTDLGAELRALGRELPVGEPPDGLADAVLTRIAELPVPRRSWLRRRWPALVAALLGLLLVGVLAPPVRATVAEWLGLGGVVVRHDPDPPPASAPPPPTAGTGLTLAEARRLVGFTPLLPRDLGTPDGVEVSADRRVLSLTWHRGGDGVLRLDQFDGRLDPSFAKSVHGDIEWVKVGGTSAWWIPRPHEVVVLAPDGTERREQARLAGKTLIWQYGSVTLRLEGDLTRDRAVAIAESAVPR